MDDEIGLVIRVCVLAVCLVVAPVLIMTADGTTTPLVGGAASGPRMHHNFDAPSSDHKRDKKQTLDIELLVTHISEDDSRDANSDVHFLDASRDPFFVLRHLADINSVNGLHIERAIAQTLIPHAVHTFCEATRDHTTCIDPHHHVRVVMYNFVT